MDFKKFLEFPGILILVGVLLLIVVLIISLVASKKSKKDKKTNADMQTGRENTNSMMPIVDITATAMEIPKEDIAPPMEQQPIATEESIIQPVGDVDVNQKVVEPVAVEEPITNNNPWQTTSNIYGGVSPTEGISIAEVKTDPVVPYEEKNFTVSETPVISKSESKEVEMPTINMDVSQDEKIDQEVEEIETL